MSQHPEKLGNGSKNVGVKVILRRLETEIHDLGFEVLECI
jgi:hypothetical protein